MKKIIKTTIAFICMICTSISFASCWRPWEDFEEWLGGKTSSSSAVGKTSSDEFEDDSTLSSSDDSSSSSVEVVETYLLPKTFEKEEYTLTINPYVAKVHVGDTITFDLYSSTAEDPSDPSFTLYAIADQLSYTLIEGNKVTFLHAHDDIQIGIDDIEGVPHFYIVHVIVIP